MKTKTIAVSPPKSLGFILLLSWLIFSFSIQATEFSDDFETTNVTTVTTFTLSDNGISASFAGGTAFTIGNAALYHSGDVSWMVEPAGTNNRGTHSGSGTITFSVPMSRIAFWVRSEFTGVTATVSLLDVDGNFAENAPITIVSSTAWTQVNFTITNGAPALQSVLFEVSGTGMAAIDDLAGTSLETVGGGGTTNPPASNSSGGGGGGSVPLAFIILLMGLVKIKVKSS